MGVIVDTGVFIRAERGGDAIGRALADDEEAGIATITLSELFEGVHHAASAAIAERRRAFVEAIASGIMLIPFTADIAETHARLRAGLRRRGELIGAHDLIVAATAVHLGWRVLTTNAGEFSRVADLSVVEASRT
jgi:predicted nucleic acid-binding protein